MQGQENENKGKEKKGNFTFCFWLALALFLSSLARMRKFLLAFLMCMSVVPFCDLGHPG